MLLPDDFKASSKIKVNNHLFHRENLPSHFKFKEYCPQVFRNLRDRFGIDDQDYLVSLTRSPPSESEGSDGRFLISYDRTLVIKEVSSEDIADMHSNLSNYHQVRPLSSLLSLLPLLTAQLPERTGRLPIPFLLYNPFCSPRKTQDHVFQKLEISRREPLHLLVFVLIESRPVPSCLILSIQNQCGLIHKGHRYNKV
ncbi:phosphatidylinositol-5-phosphate 4-kinase type 2 gamma [Phyllostomus discolor]|uniref:Phosphatidylinositol 5-phosphate 4-kinase type-2 gamma n=1 Tax=Phyllostomus discolor TaxID=89673 RepID=A0A834ELA5_9CHIR|nr:phosphatidylinositol-5-phosphate 4-kinase type 2 gamma [Phyllostomus discolor]